MNVRLVTSKEEWEGFVPSRSEANFLQSWNWGVFQERLGRKVFRLGLYEGKKMIGAATAVKEVAKRGTYLTVAGGPLVEWNNQAGPAALIEALREYGTREGCSFVRLRPQVLDTPDNRRIVGELGLLPAPMHLTADLVFRLDVRKSLDELLAGMKKNTRYEIRRVEKMGVAVRQSKDSADIVAFAKYHAFLAKKHKFVSYSHRFLANEFETFVKEDQVVLFHAYRDDELLASAFVVYYNKEGAYHHGISTPENAGLPGAYACQWEAIVEARRRGMRWYNFWGVAPQGARYHRYAGVRKFKEGFGGEEVAYLPAHDLPLDYRYWLVRGFELVRKKLRRL